MKAYEISPVKEILDELRKAVPEAGTKEQQTLYRALRKSLRGTSEMMHVLGIDYNFVETPEGDVKGYWTNRDIANAVEEYRRGVFDKYPHLHRWLADCVQPNGEPKPDDPRTYEEYSKAFDRTRFSDVGNYAPRMTRPKGIKELGQGKSARNRQEKQKDAAETRRKKKK